MWALPRQSRGVERSSSHVRAVERTFATPGGCYAASGWPRPSGGVASLGDDLARIGVVSHARPCSNKLAAHSHRSARRYVTSPSGTRVPKHASEKLGGEPAWLSSNSPPWTRRPAVVSSNVRPRMFAIGFATASPICRYLTSRAGREKPIARTTSVVRTAEHLPLLGTPADTSQMDGRRCVCLGTITQARRRRGGEI